MRLRRSGQRPAGGAGSRRSGRFGAGYGDFRAGRFQKAFRTAARGAYSVALASVYEIEKYNILNSALLAMDRAAQTLCVSPSLALVDGNTVRGLSIPARAVVGGDGICPSVAAASVLAKVTRDRIMEHFDKLYPGYGFSAHKVYGTKAHYAAITQLGPTPLHRMSFLKKLYER